LGGGTTETLKDLIGRRVLADVDPVDGILRLGRFDREWSFSRGRRAWMPGLARRAIPE
jgi:hypothetical protein